MMDHELMMMHTTFRDIWRSYQQPDPVLSIPGVFQWKNIINKY